MPTVAFPLLGQYGRLGNQLFQMATTIAHAYANKATPAFPLWEYAHHFPRLPKEWFRRQVAIKGEYYEPEYKFKHLPYWDDMGLFGYFQSPKYWEQADIAEPWAPGGILSQRHVGPFMRFLLTPGRPVWARDMDKTCAVHVRRGDYLRMPEHHPVQPIQYYLDGCSIAADKWGAKKFCVMSDDIGWCENELKPALQSLGSVTVSNASEVYDLWHLADAPCKVIANSSFSWWGGYLGSNKNVIYPKNWFGPEYPDHTTKDLIPEGWVGL